MTYRLVGTAILLAVLGATEVHARSARVSQIPNGSVSGCANCHVNPSGGGTRNAFGLAVEQGFLSGSGASGVVQWNATLAGRDSDGDGTTNGQELGDPDGDGNPTAGAQVTNPGDANSKPVVPNRAPEFTSIDPQTILEGATLSLEVQATDPDNDAISVSATDLPEGASVDGTTFSWTPGFDQGDASYTVSLTASDGVLTSSVQLTIVVGNVDRNVSILSASPPGALVVSAPGGTVDLQVSAEDPDGDAVQFVWTTNGNPQVETGSSFVHTVSADESDDVITVSVSSGSDPLAWSWSIAKSLKGDFNSDGSVTFTDFLDFVRVFGKGSTEAEFDGRFDLNQNSKIDFPDFLTFVRFYGLSAP